MRLSDAFKTGGQTKDGAGLPQSLQLDLTVKVYNINKSANHPILARCEPLLAYANFTEYARTVRKVPWRMRYARVVGGMSSPSISKR